MRMFFSKKKPIGNTRRSKQAVKPVRKPMRWVKPMLQGLAVSSAVVIAGFGVWKLNEKLSISYWDIEAASHIKPQIQAYLAKQQDLDFWHTRADVLHDELLLEVPDIQTLQVQRILPDGLLVKAKARTPMALWKDEQKQMVMLVDAFGYAYRALHRGEASDLPLLRVQADELPQATKLLLALNQFDVRKLMQLSEVIVSDSGWHLNFAKGEQWNINPSNLEQHVTQIINVLGLPRWAKGHWRIDTRIPERWFIRPAKQEVI